MVALTVGSNQAASSTVIMVAAFGQNEKKSSVGVKEKLTYKLSFNSNRLYKFAINYD